MAEIDMSTVAHVTCAYYYNYVCVCGRVMQTHCTLLHYHQHHHHRHKNVNYYLTNRHSLLLWWWPSSIWVCRSNTFFFSIFPSRDGKKALKLMKITASQHCLWQINYFRYLWHMNCMQSVAILCGKKMAERWEKGNDVFHYLYTMYACTFVCVHVCVRAYDDRKRV